MPRAKTKVYTVGNPAACPKGTPILSYADGTEFFEGDVFKPKAATTPEIIEKLVARGFLKEVVDG